MSQQMVATNAVVTACSCPKCGATLAILPAREPGVEIDLMERPAVLTNRQQDVVTGLAEGRTLRAVATQMGVSPRTAEDHRAHAMRRCGARGLADLVRFAIRRGWVDP